MDEAIAATTESKRGGTELTMARKQLKAIARRKAIRRKRNIRANNPHENPMRESHQSRTYRLANI